MGRKKRERDRDKGRRGMEAPEFLTGTLDITRSGMGYVSVPDRDLDIMVRPGDFDTALHGDTVRVRLLYTGRRARPQGEVVEVVARKQVEFAGHLQRGDGFAFFIPEGDTVLPDVYIPGDKTMDAREDELVVVRITAWKQPRKPVGEVVQILKDTDESDFAMKQLLMEHGFPLSFPDDVLEEAARIPDRIPADEIQSRRDMREVFTITIDPADARDFDDAISLKMLPDGNFELGVHIADVSYYVQPGSAMDREAYQRGTSVYLPDRVVPMLPEHISNELCSLRPHEDKLTFSAVFTITPRGSVKSSWLGRTVTHSNHRFTYEEVQEIIEAGAGLYSKEIIWLHNFAQKLRKQRFRKGAINFSSQEVRFKLDEQGRPIGIMIKENKEANQLIEELMLLANRTVASYVSGLKWNRKPVPFPFRVHDTPDEQKLLPFVAFARKYGHQFNTSTPRGIAESFNAMIERAQGTPQQHVLEQLGIRTMAKAIYTTENIGHYGLAFEQYCHFTSPIRRYPDILVHRILQQCLDGQEAPDKQLEVKCRHCSERERAAMETERAANKYKQVEYMRNFLGEEFEGVISGVASFGFWVETAEHKCEGLVSLNSLLEYDEFRMVEEEYCLVGRRSGKMFRMGDKIRIKVVAANLAKRQLDYEWVITSAMAEEQRNGRHPGLDRRSHSRKKDRPLIKSKKQSRKR